MKMYAMKYLILILLVGLCACRKQDVVADKITFTNDSRSFIWRKKDPKRTNDPNYNGGYLWSTNKLVPALMVTNSLAAIHVSDWGMEALDPRTHIIRFSPTGISWVLSNLSENCYLVLTNAVWVQWPGAYGPPIFHLSDAQWELFTNRSSIRTNLVVGHITFEDRTE